MRCSLCERDKAAGEFSKSQLKKAAGGRKCMECAANTNTGAGNKAAGLAVPPNRPAEGGGGTPTGGTAKLPAPSAGAAVGTGGGAPADIKADPPPAPSPSAGTGPNAAAESDPHPAPPPPKVCSWVDCGKQLSPDPNQWLKCGRCKREHYCDRSCQKGHWKQGGHKQACKEPPCCIICLEGGDDPLPMQSGCACRGEAGIAHVACRALVAAHKGAGTNTAWSECPTCGQPYTGGMQMGLARELKRHTAGRVPADPHRLLARRSLGVALRDAGKHGEAEAVFRDVLAIYRRVFGRANPLTRIAATDLGVELVQRGQHAEAAALLREVLAATPAKEMEREDALATKVNLASALSLLGEHTEAEALVRGVNAAHERAHGLSDARTLMSATMLGDALQRQGKHTEAVDVFRTTLAAQRRVLGPGHPQTLNVMHNLACSLAQQGSYTEVETLLREVVKGRRRALGPNHVDTLSSTTALAGTLRYFGKHAEAEALR